MVRNHRSHLATIFKDIPKPSLPIQTVTKRQARAVKREESTVKKPYKKKPIPVAIREATWVLRCGRVFEHKCLTTWCPNMLTVFEFQAGHDIPESKGGATNPGNLYPICARCNLSMGNRFTFKEWCEIQVAEATPVAPTEDTPPPPPPPPRGFFSRYFRCWATPYHA
jgi:hypothetical protein